MTELQGAVALAQFDRLASIEASRRDIGDYLSKRIGQIPGILPHKVTPGGQCSYWFYMLRVDEAKLGLSRDEFVKRCNEQGLGAGAGYVPVPICHEPVFLKKAFFPGGVWPAEVVAGRTYDYSKTKVPAAELVLKTAARIGINENYTRADVDDIYKIMKHVADGAKQ
jgi:dTDP-4-amino-4,6-dideoxygalactose transaminase